MATTTFLPIGTDPMVLISKGDIIELITGEKMTFLEMKRTKWIGSNSDGKRFNIPIYRDRLGNTPYAKSKVGINKDVIIKSQLTSLTAGDLFAIENGKQTFMFKQQAGNKVLGIDLATGNVWKIGSTCTFKKVEINKIKQLL